MLLLHGSKVRHMKRMEAKRKKNAKQRNRSVSLEEMKQPVGGDDSKAGASRGEQEQRDVSSKGNVETNAASRSSCFSGVNLRDMCGTHEF